ncbi:MAG: oligosaccharide flippase family protein [Chitinophagaceae bacterium]
MPATLLATIKRNFFFNFLLSCAQVLFPLFSIPYISRILDPEGVGRVGFIDSFTYYFIVLAELGITVYGIREVASRRNDAVQLQKLVAELLLLHMISSGVALLFYVAGVAILWEKIGDSRLVLFSVLFFVVNFFSCDWYFIGREKFGFIAIRTIIVRLLALLSIFLLIDQPADFYLYYGIIAASGIASILWNIAILLEEMPVSLRSANWRQHLPKVMITYLIAILYSIPIWLDNVLLGLVSTATAVGYYAFAVKLIRTGTTVLTDSFLVFFPRIVSLAGENDEKQLQEKLLMNIQFILLFAVPMGAGLFLLADDFTSVFYGSGFAMLQNDLKILALFPLLKGISLFLSNPVLIAHRFERIFLNNLLIGSVFFLITALLLGHWKEDAGVSTTLVLTEVLLIILNYLSVRRLLPMIRIFDWKSFFHAVAGAMLFIPLTYLTGKLIADPLPRLMVSVVICVLFYFGFITFIVRNEFALKLKSTLFRSISRSV